ncbi:MULTISPECIES: gamma-glutamyltransferase [Psychrobacter]|uniref:gamma-glutamyltransferase n=1 Tax=Psychrobacter TaxID=497 RepID=UPI00086E6950|nr:MULTISPECIES: gamma-glutamyltransferase [Psychrobacter]MBA6245267.1 gamma-glutamyltransferase [Psychrobacter sp. Urea-trap-18]MBA6285668.1 gamma-glutamyltransferase [Psychrobacter sp. Urea-trap-16]MBA6318915.1 gamma-glutamyltransferase [Psychrobacter sp. Urea-trap-20]MBA6333944.1 gamma-glutamyltransferase [Psychrobacter sp. Urea-trap-19]OEH68884.1 MAG: gamma-glutamyltransferase [Psychrobacter sp. B29-1]|tara:strand:- start:4751 stop:6709 length:1959 start_codon:yes stop_codon:yes gene_type:complete
MSQLLSRHHRTAQQRKPKINTLLKSSVVLITSTLLLSISTQAVEPTNSTSNATVNNTSINTSAINLAIMADSPTVLSETKRITRAKTNTLSTESNNANNANSDQAIYSEDAIHHPVWAKNGMVATQEALASDIGLQILKDGGNAVDAGVAVGFALAVTLPRAGNIGGGGFMMIYDAKQGKTVALDYREKAPSSASRDMYLDKEGNAVSDLSRYHGLAVGVPGTVAGLLKALEEHGTMSREQVMAPAIALAENGIEVTAGLSESLTALSDRLQKWPSTKKVFFKPDGSAYQPGERLKQPELARSLKRIAVQGTDGFYKGETAQKLVKAVNEAGGSMSLQDLANYQAIAREPVKGDYRGYEIVSMPPPSSGGIHIVQILNILEGYPLKDYGQNSAQTIHLMAEAMQLAYADRAEYLGDADFIDVPASGLTSQAYADKLRTLIDPNKATPAATIKANNPLPYESDQTTHFSIVDKDGNAIANTYTLNFSYGTGLVADGTGILLNNEMDDFSAKPGVPNGYGLLGGDANAVEANKRPLSSMSPTLVFKDSKPYIVTGSPGGSRIITTVTQIISNVIDHDMNIAEATHAPRIHDQWLPDEIRVEKALNIDTVKKLESMGHTVSPKSAMGSTQSIMLTPNGVYGSSDPRIVDAAVVGY